MKNLKIKNIIGIIILTILSTVVGYGLYTLQIFNYKTVPIELSSSIITPIEAKPIAENLKIPWSIAFTSPNRMIVTERPGRVRVILDEKLQEKPLHTFDEVASNDEEGLMGVAVDPDYTNNKYLFFMYAYRKESKLTIKVVRMVDNTDSLVGSVTLLDNIEATQNHAGGRIAFGPDKKLYITTGDATNIMLPQNLNSVNGKLLRMNNDGGVPSDNPFPNSLIWSYGHRNAQGLAWDNRNGNLLSTEHGPSIFDGPSGGDELNLIKKGANYGWPTVSNGRKLAGADNELIMFTPAIAPGGIAFYTGTEFPQLNNSFIFAGLAGQGLYQVISSDKNTPNYNNYQKLQGIDIGRIRDIVQSPNGQLFFVTSNTDYRGTPKPNDDKIYKLIPKK